jgi:hypothetical protein
MPDQTIEHFAERGGLAALLSAAPSGRTEALIHSLKRKKPNLSVELFAERGGQFSNPLLEDLKVLEELNSEIEQNEMILESHSIQVR